MSKYKLDLEDLNYRVLHEEKNNSFSINNYSDSYFELLKNTAKVVIKSVYSCIIFIIDISKNPIESILQVAYSRDKCFFTNTEIKQYYVANFQSSYWGKSGELIAKTLVGLINNTDLEIWNKQNKIFTLEEKHIHSF